MLRSHGRFEYSPIMARPDFSWPGGQRLAVYIARVHGALLLWRERPRIVVLPGHPAPEHLQLGVAGIRQPRRRLAPAGDARAARRAANGAPQHRVLRALPRTRRCISRRGRRVRRAWPHELGAARTSSTNETEREMIRDVFETMSRHEGKPPGGLDEPGANPSAVTEDLLAEIGFTYTLDWPMDDQPTWMRTRGGPLLSVPYPHEVNDVPMIALHHGTAGAFAEMVIDNLDEMVEQSAASGPRLRHRHPQLHRGSALPAAAVPAGSRASRRAAGRLADDARARSPSTTPASTPAEAAVIRRRRRMTRVAVAGLGAIGRSLVARLAEGLPGHRAVGVAARDPAGGGDAARARRRGAGQRRSTSSSRLPTWWSNARRRTSFPRSPSPFSERQGSRRTERRRAARASAICSSSPRLHGGRISVPTGALLGLDAVGGGGRRRDHARCV